MKRQFNEEELLGLFTDSSNDLRPMYAKPYLKDGYVCATNGRCLVRIKADMTEGRYEPVTGLNIPIPEDNCNCPVTDKDLEKALAGVPQVEETTGDGEDGECPECHGYGTVYWEYTDNNGRLYEYEHDCPVCDGSGYVEKAEPVKTGRMIPSPEASFCFRNRNLRTDSVQILLAAMKATGATEVRLVAQKDHISVFRIDGNIEIVISSYLEKADYTVIKKV